MSILMVQDRGTVFQLSATRKEKERHIFLHTFSVCTNKRRETIRKERILLLKRSTTPLFRDRERVKRLSQQSSRQFDFKERGVPVVSNTQHIAISNSVWKRFTNAFMRDGAKLRYQSILRKALLSL